VLKDEGRDNMAATPVLRIDGRGARTRLCKQGRWGRDPLADLAVTCRAHAAADKALGESLRAARTAGRSWSQIAVGLGLPATLTTWQEISTAFAENHRRIWGWNPDAS
jgi:hypothetical protein